jgi:mRNA interferase MazF
MPYPQSPPRRGEVYQVDFSPARGSEQAGRRPAVVISLDSFNTRMPVVVVAAVTSQVKSYVFTVDLPEGKPLERHSQVLAFQVMTVDKTRLAQYAGSLDADQLSRLKDALKTAWGL